MCSPITVLGRQEPSFAIRLRALFKMTFVNELMTIHGSNPTKLMQSRTSHTIRMQLSGTVREFACMGQMTATRCWKLEAGPFPARFRQTLNTSQKHTNPTLSFHHQAISSDPIYTDTWWNQSIIEKYPHDDVVSTNLSNSRSKSDLHPHNFSLNRTYYA